MPGIKIRRGQRVRIVTMNGCMASVRDNPREGTVVAIHSEKLYGDTRPKRYATIKLDNGETTMKVAAPGQWNMHEGLPEYQE